MPGTPAAATALPPGSTAPGVSVVPGTQPGFLGNTIVTPPPPNMLRPGLPLTVFATATPQLLAALGLDPRLGPVIARFDARTNVTVDPTTGRLFHAPTGRRSIFVPGP